jgi:hypothetical protein
MLKAASMIVRLRHASASMMKTGSEPDPQEGSDPDFSGER